MLNKSFKIFFDTNFLEVRSGKHLNKIDNIRFSNDFFDILNNINNEKVSFFIPDIVTREIKKHFKESFDSNKQSFESKIREYKEILNNILEIDYSFKYPNTEKYSNFIDNELNNYIKNIKNIEICNIKNEINVLENLILKSIDKKKPFSSAKGSGKTFSDAGFKDALLIENIIENIDNSKNEIGILMTKDNDFKEIEKEYNYIKVFSNIKDLKDYLKDYIDITIDTEIKSYINNSYFKETILEQLGLNDINLISDYKINQLNKSSEDDYILELKLVYNESVYNINLNIDFNAKEIYNLNYEISND